MTQAAQRMAGNGYKPWDEGGSAGKFLGTKEWWSQEGVTLPQIYVLSILSDNQMLQRTLWALLGSQKRRKGIQMNPGMFSSLGGIKTTFGHNGIACGGVKPAVISGISENFTAVATSIFQNTADTPARFNALELLYKSYLATVGTMVTHPIVTGY